jgi:hypothetical protein
MTGTGGVRAATGERIPGDRPVRLVPDVWVGLGDDLFTQFVAWTCERKLSGVHVTRLDVEWTVLDPLEPSGFVIVSAAGMLAGGSYEPLTFGFGRRSDPQFWSGLFADLRARGVVGVQVVAARPCTGLTRAAAETFPGVTRSFGAH